MAKVKNYVVVNGVKYAKVSKVAKPTSSNKGFSGLLKDLKTFVNRKKNTRHIATIKPNGKTKSKVYTTKAGKTNTYVFKGVDIEYKDGTKAEKYYQDLSYKLKKEW